VRASSGEQRLASAAKISAEKLPVIAIVAQRMHNATRYRRSFEGEDWGLTCSREPLASWPEGI